MTKKCQNGKAATNGRLTAMKKKTGDRIEDVVTLREQGNKNG